MTSQFKNIKSLPEGAEIPEGAISRDYMALIDVGVEEAKTHKDESGNITVTGKFHAVVPLASPDSGTLLYYDPSTGYTGSIEKQKVRKIYEITPIYI